MINKNISIWRGSIAPPTNYHLWEKEDGGLYVYLDERWQHLVTPTDKIILDKHQQQLDKIKNLALTEIDPIDTNTYKSYQLKSDDNVFGTTINIPKDRFIKQVTLGYDNATIDASTGAITIGTGLSKEYLLFSVALESGSYELVSINLTNFLTEKDYSDGLEVIDNKLKVKVDPSSEEYLKVTNNGVKIEGINTKVSDTVDDIKNKIQNGEWLPLKRGRKSDGTFVDDSVAMGYQSEATGYGSTAMGYNCKASGNTAHAENAENKAEGDNSHAEGYGCVASSFAAHAEGEHCKAVADTSHAEGSYTIASGYYSHAQGHCNYDDKSFIDMVGVGNHTDVIRKNASVIYVGRDTNNHLDSSDPKNGYQYLLGVGGYQGQEIGDAKSVQEVFADLENNKVDKVEGKSLVSNTDITKLSELPNNATLNTNIADAKKAGTDAQISINTHINDTNNPHNVTKAQVGLDQVNNTSDINKPISIATQSALDSKVDKIEGKQLSTNDYTTAEKNKVAESINESTANTLINTAIGKLTKASVGLDNVDNTADANKEVLSATKLKTARTLWGQSFDGTANVSGNITGIGNGTTAKLNIESVSALVDYIHIYLPEARRPLVLQKDHGKVGIGVEAPTEKLEVDGSIKLTGSVKNVTEIYTTDGSKYAEPCTSDDIKTLFA